MAWRVWVCATTTGAKRQLLPVSSFSWDRVLNGGGGGSASVQLNDPTVKKLNVRDLTAPSLNTLVIEWDGVPVYAGVIWSRSYDRQKALLTLGHEDLWSVFARRLSIDRSQPNVEKTEQVHVGLSLATIAKRRILLDRVGDTYDNRLLPITLPGDVAGPHTRTYYGYQLDMLGDVLRDLVNEGPDIDFAPRWVDGRLDFLMRTGSEAAPKLTAGRVEVNLAAMKTGASEVNVGEDAGKLATAIYGVGEGSEEDMLVRSADVPNPPGPGLDLVIPYKKETNRDRLLRRVVADRAVYQSTTTQWSMGIRAGGKPAVTDLTLGGTVAVYVLDDPWLADGWHNSRLLGFSGDLSEGVSLKFQPVGGV